MYLPIGFINENFLLILLLLTDYQIYLFYVNSNNSLACVNFEKGMNGWIPGMMDLSSVAPFSISQRSESFTAAAIYDAKITGPGLIALGILVMLYDSNENLLVLYGNTPDRLSPIIWKNVTGLLFGSQYLNWHPEAAGCNFSNLVPFNNSYSIEIKCPGTVPDLTCLTPGCVSGVDFLLEPQTDGQTCRLLKRQSHACLLCP